MEKALDVFESFFVFLGYRMDGKGYLAVCGEEALQIWFPAILFIEAAVAA